MVVDIIYFTDLELPRTKVTGNPFKKLARSGKPLDISLWSYLG